MVPFHPSFFPVIIPFHLCSWFNKKLHFHLFKFTHSENKLPGNNFVAKCFPCLCNAEGYFHTTGFLHIQKIYKNSLCCFGAQIYRSGIISYRTHLRTKHKIKLSYLCPVARTAYRTNNFTIFYNLFH